MGNQEVCNITRGWPVSSHWRLLHCLQRDHWSLGLHHHILKKKKKLQCQTFRRSCRIKGIHFRNQRGGCVLYRKIMNEQWCVGARSGITIFFINSSLFLPFKINNWHFESINKHVITFYPFLGTFHIHVNQVPAIIKLLQLYKLILHFPLSFYFLLKFLRLKCSPLQSTRTQGRTSVIIRFPFYQVTRHFLNLFIVSLKVCKTHKSLWLSCCCRNDM